MPELARNGLLEKDQLINELINFQLYKMPDGKQLYEASMEELKHEYNKVKQKIKKYT
ncbi:Fur-regulated basic protein FbpA [Pseudalkalibacillus caeni]|uniref:Fur-regulated basic protein FbpA n=1 Tax=Exobacillus caeni TaxID=2574798 RepID=A0A5R9F5J1_9BACL|nr:Fur-regulated basic protein FbpA [Pseudalkalibacillus caeni]TLS36083.1 Fur-regulated basic protein FbpA [Pseudalkalibacillus caeni]